MTLRTAGLIFVTALAGCAADLGESGVGDTPDLIVLNSVFVDGNNSLPENLKSSTLPGTWVEKDGSFFCDGYLTNNEGINFCAAEPPKEWQSFMFNGVKYYYQPLTSRR